MKPMGSWPKLMQNLESLSIERAMHYTCTAPLYGGSHRHENKFHIAYVFVGKSRIKIQDRYFEVGPSDAIFIPARTKHASVGDVKTFFELVEIVFLVNGFRAEAAVPPLPTVVHVHHPAAMIPTLDQCVSAHLIDTKPNNWLAKVRLAEVLMLIEREAQWLIHAATYPTDIHLKIHQAREHIALHYAQPLSVESLADLVCFSPGYFATSFKSIVGTSPIEFVIQTRLHHAKELLTGSNFSIGQVAEICGFCSSQYFARIFQQREHVSPLMYRRRYAT
ncbi:MAG: AraC family transcriptional regulator [Phycisphaerae bacterium]